MLHARCWFLIPEFIDEIREITCHKGGVVKSWNDLFEKEMIDYLKAKANPKKPKIEAQLKSQKLS